MKLQFTQDTHFSLYRFDKGQIIESDTLHQSLVGLLIYAKRVVIVNESAKEVKRK